MREEFLTYKLKNMSLNDKIGQMLMIDYRDVPHMTVELERILTNYNPGGFILFKSNIRTFNQTRQFLNDIKNATNIRPMVSVDQEGGRVQRLDERVGFQKYPPASEIGKTMDINVAFELGAKIGAELRAIGVDMNMAPVLDIFSNPQNKVVADRAFGTNIEIVKAMALAYAEGLKKENVIAVGKHFPGHGDTIKDSHIDLPIIEKDLDALRQLELIPFIEAVKQKLPGLMIAHIAVPKVTNDVTPASLSKIMICDLLRNDMGYTGLIMPDSLKMKALTNYFNNEDIYLRCIEAGNDFILMPQNIKEAYEIIYRKVSEGIISEERIEQSVYRILETKFDYGFFAHEYQEFLKYNKPYVKRK